MDAETRAKFESLYYNANHQTRLEIKAILDQEPAVPSMSVAKEESCTNVQSAAIRQSMSAPNVETTG